jgi:threonine dehydratase
MHAARLGDQTWPLLQRCVDAVVEVSEGEIVEAMRLLMEAAHVVVEPSGAAALAAALSPAFARMCAGCRTVAVVLSGGNVDFERVAFWQGWARAAGTREDGAGRQEEGTGEDVAAPEGCRQG